MNELLLTAMRVGIRVTFFLSDVDGRCPVYAIEFERGQCRMLHWQEQRVVDACKYDVLGVELRRGLKTFLYKNWLAGDPDYQTL